MFSVMNILLFFIDPPFLILYLFRYIHWCLWFKLWPSLKRTGSHCGYLIVNDYTRNTARGSQCKDIVFRSLQRRHNERDGVSNHRRLDCLHKCLFRRRSKKRSKFRVTGLCEGIHRWPMNSPHKGPVITRKCFHLMTSSYAVGGYKAVVARPFCFKATKYICSHPVC